ncbi:MAG: C25 family cysteine peptidase [Bacteroidetes bacterium]|nr:C25 family cysteine peptidase [Bacteroidota bacterium]
MKKISFLLLFGFLSVQLFSGTIEKQFHIGNYSLKTVGAYQTISFDNAKLSGIPGEPSLPYLAVSLMLPPGESAVSIEIIRENETVLPGSYLLFPEQDVVPISKKQSGEFRMKESVYRMNGNYPAYAGGKLLSQYLNGFSFALSTFTPVNYNPSTGQLSYFRDVTVRIKTQKDPEAEASLNNLSASQPVLNRVRLLAQNTEMIDQYPAPAKKKSSYQMLIITPFAFEDGFTDLVNYYSAKGLTTHIESTEDINAGFTGFDQQEKIRNFIKQEYQNNGIEYVLLGGSEEWVPSRKFYCIVYYGTGGVEAETYDIPADIYYSAIDGTDDLNGNHIYGEEADSTDLLPDVAVGRFPFSTSADLASMVHKTVSYQENPVLGEYDRPLFIGEYLYDTPVTLGGDYMNLLIDDHNDNGYFTHGIPSASNHIERLYDTLTGNPPPYNYWHWSTDTLLAKINRGTSFIHHLGHAATSYMLCLDYSQINNPNFWAVDGIRHNYALLYTQGCDDGSFDMPYCIATKSMAIDNFVVAGIFNTRYGWFNQGTTDGPSQHLQREFVSAMYTDTQPEDHIGTVHMISKIKTAPWVGLPGEFEPGAQRWTMYDCTLLGDPALHIWTHDPVIGIPVVKNSMNIALYPNPSHGMVQVDYSIPETSVVTLQILDATGQQVAGVHSWKAEAGVSHRYTVDVSSLPAGIYYCRFSTDNGIQTKKLVIIR